MAAIPRCPQRIRAQLWRAFRRDGRWSSYRHLWPTHGRWPTPSRAKTVADGLLLQERHRAAARPAFRRPSARAVEVWAYGSRVTGRAHEGSDLDLALRAPGGAAIEPARLGAFCRALEASTIPFLVQPHDWARLPDRFRREIERGHTVLRHGPEPGNPPGTDPDRKRDGPGHPWFWRSQMPRYRRARRSGRGASWNAPEHEFCNARLGITPPLVRSGVQVRNDPLFSNVEKVIARA